MRLVTVTAETRDQVQSLANTGLDIFAVEDNKVLVLLWSDREQNQLDTLQLPYEVIYKNRTELNAALAPYLLSADTTPAGAFHTYTEMTTDLALLAASYPDRVQLLSCGTTWEGRLITGVRLGVTTTFSKPEFLIIGNQHARDWISLEVAFGIATAFAEQYNSDTRIRRLMDNLDIYILPTVNPDGHTYCVNVERLWRKNRRNNGDGTFGVDLNRNFEYQWGLTSGASTTSSSMTYMGPYPFSEPENIATRDFILSHSHLIGMMNYHSYGQKIMYPWAYTYNPPPNQSWLNTLTASMKTAIVSVNTSSYTNGQWSVLLSYLGSGETADWINARVGLVYITIELPPISDPPGFIPADTAISPAVRENIAGIITMMDYTLTQA
jgi:murein tripeptide amidase MpaA